MTNEWRLTIDPSSQKAADEARSALRPALEEARSMFIRWSKKAYWTHQEAVMLALGLDPEADPLLVQILLPDAQPKFEEFLDLIKRRFPTGRVPPQEFAAWNREQNIGVARELVAAIEGRNPARKPEGRPTDIAKIRHSLETMIVSMAIDKYGYDPNDKKGSTAKSIRSAVERIGMKITDATVLKRLKDALDRDSADPELVEAVQRFFQDKSKLGR